MRQECAQTEPDGRRPTSLHEEAEVSASGHADSCRGAGYIASELMNYVDVRWRSAGPDGSGFYTETIARSKQQMQNPALPQGLITVMCTRSSGTTGRSRSRF